jgi:hypothetical protein
MCALISFSQSYITHIHTCYMLIPLELNWTHNLLINIFIKKCLKNLCDSICIKKLLLRSIKWVCACKTWPVCHFLFARHLLLTLCGFANIYPESLISRHCIHLWSDHELLKRQNVIRFKGKCSEKLWRQVVKPQNVHSLKFVASL